MYQSFLIGRRWKRSDFTGPADRIAHKLIGRVLVRTLDDGTVLAGRIVETEAYMGAKDAASHAFKGRRTQRNDAMYRGPGIAYVYFTYGMHYCVNAVCGEEGDPNAVLIRAIEPLLGIQTMRRHRAGRAPGGVGRSRRTLSDTDLCSGPAKLCQALAIDRRLNGLDMVREPSLFVAEPTHAGGGRRGGEGDPRVRRTARIGIDYAGEWVHRPLRFVVEGHPHASRRESREGSRRGGGRAVRTPISRMDRGSRRGRATGRGLGLTRPGWNG